ncbi:hypothetical protein ACFS32_03130 [Novosphingobium pokkalii]|uniref:hypothetical protein n=1 Tax=Novosphingobium pokkalii TaxID=1770194 RepID=UPI00362E0948
MRSVAALLATLALVGCVPARLPALEATLAAQPSATAALTQWCAAGHLADPATIAPWPIAHRARRPTACAPRSGLARQSRWAFATCAWPVVTSSCPMRRTGSCRRA